MGTKTMKFGITTSYETCWKIGDLDLFLNVTEIKFSGNMSANIEANVIKPGVHWHKVKLFTDVHWHKGIDELGDGDIDIPFKVTEVRLFIFVFC